MAFPLLHPPAQYAPPPVDLGVLGDELDQPMSRRRARPTLPLPSAEELGLPPPRRDVDSILEFNSLVTPELIGRATERQPAPWEFREGDGLMQALGRGALLGIAQNENGRMRDEYEMDRMYGTLMGSLGSKNAPAPPRMTARDRAAIPNLFSQYDEAEQARREQALEELKALAYIQAQNESARKTNFDAYDAYMGSMIDRGMAPREARKLDAEAFSTERLGMQRMADELRTDNLRRIDDEMLPYDQRVKAAQAGASDASAASSLSTRDVNRERLARMQEEMEADRPFLKPDAASRSEKLRGEADEAKSKARLGQWEADNPDKRGARDGQGYTSSDRRMRVDLLRGEIKAVDEQLKQARSLGNTSPTKAEDIAELEATRADIKQELDDLTKPKGAADGDEGGEGARKRIRNLGYTDAQIQEALDQGFTIDEILQVAEGD